MMTESKPVWPVSTLPKYMYRRTVSMQYREGLSFMCARSAHHEYSHSESLCHHLHQLEDLSCGTAPEYSNVVGYVRPHLSDRPHCSLPRSNAWRRFSTHACCRL